MIELLIDEKLVTTSLNRPDLPSSEVEADFVFNLDDSKDDDQFINNDEIKDDTLVNDCDSEEDLQIKEDTDIDE